MFRSCKFYIVIKNERTSDTSQNKEHEDINKMFGLPQIWNLITPENCCNNESNNWGKTVDKNHIGATGENETGIHEVCKQQFSDDNNTKNFVVWKPEINGF